MLTPACRPHFHEPSREALDLDDHGAGLGLDGSDLGPVGGRARAETDRLGGCLPGREDSCHPFPSRLALPSLQQGELARGEAEALRRLGRFGHRLDVDAGP